MSKYNFQNWLKQKISDDPEVILAGKLEHLRLYLTDAMREIRTKAGLTQAQLAEKLGVQQAAISKLESPLKEREIESVLNYLHALNADFLVAVKHGEDFYQASDNEELLLVDVPVEVEQKAIAAGMSVSQYVREAIDVFSPQKQDIKQILTQLLESEDTIAIEVRKRLQEKEISEIVTDLEKCFNIADEDDRVYAVKTLLAGSSANTWGLRNSSQGNDELELLNLAEELIEKLSSIIK
jgi:transcriptional regulator with XRE-family HTH domain